MARPKAKNPGKAVTVYIPGQTLEAILLTGSTPAQFIRDCIGKHMGIDVAEIPDEKPDLPSDGLAEDKSKKNNGALCGNPRCGRIGHCTCK